MLCGLLLLVLPAVGNSVSSLRANSSSSHLSTPPHRDARRLTSCTTDDDCVNQWCFAATSNCTPYNDANCAGLECGLGDGDCDGDDECAAGLYCGTDNCGEFHAYNPQPTSDCCADTPDYFGNADAAASMVQTAVADCVNRYKDESFDSVFSDLDPTYVTVADTPLWMLVALPIVGAVAGAGYGLYNMYGRKVGSKRRQFLVLGGSVMLGAVGVFLVGLFADQCATGGGLVVRLHQISFTGDVTTDQFLWWNDDDEIYLTAKSGTCEYEGPTMLYNTDKRSYSFGDELNFWFNDDMVIQLVEDDSGLYGNDDFSNTFTLSGEVVARIRTAIQNNYTDHVAIDHDFLVDGQTIFEESFFGSVLDSFTCVSALDFIAGPAVSRIKGSIKKATFATYKTSARTYQDTGKIFYKQFAHAVSDAKVFEYGFAEMVKVHGKKSLQAAVLSSISDEMTKGLLGAYLSEEDATILADNVDAITQCTTDTIADVYLGDKEQVAELYGTMQAVNNVMDTLSFCLSDVFSSEDASYAVEMDIMSSSLDWSDINFDTFRRG